MGKHIQWRTPNESVPQSFGEMTTFGGRRDRGHGYLAHSQRVGPGVVLVHGDAGLTDDIRGLADELCAEGFTVLVPDLAEVADVDAILTAAITTLRDNWHPRVGAVDMGSEGRTRAAGAISQMLDGLVLCAVDSTPDLDVPAMTISKLSADDVGGVADFLHHHLS